MTVEEAKQHLNVAMDKTEQGDFQEAEALCNQVLQSVEPDTATAAEANRVLGWLEISRGQYPEAFNYLNASVTLALKLGDRSLLAIPYAHLGVLFTDLTDYSQALDYLSKSLALADELQMHPLIHINHLNLGTLYNKLGDYSRALEYFNKTLAAYEQSGNVSNIALVTGNIGVVYTRTEEHDLASEYLLKAISMFESLKLNARVATGYNTLGVVYENKGEYATAIQYFKAAASLSENNGNKRTRLISLLNTGHILSLPHADVYNPDKAEALLQEALVTGEEMQTKELLMEAHKSLAFLYKHLQQWQKCSHHFECMHTLDQELRKTEVLKKTQQYQTERKVMDMEREQQVKVARYQEQEKILHNILPSAIAERILSGETQIADHCDKVSVFFSDIVGFTQLSTQVTPVELVEMLSQLFKEFDRVARKYGLEKIKTIGDAYMAVAGVPEAMENHALNTAHFALEVMEVMQAYRSKNNTSLEIRVGLHTGSAVAGVIGENKFAYDLWGDAVNTASRMESHGQPGKIQISEDFKNALQNAPFHFEERGEVEVKGKGKMKTYFLYRR